MWTEISWCFAHNLGWNQDSAMWDPSSLGPTLIVAKKLFIHFSVILQQQNFFFFHSTPMHSLSTSFPRRGKEVGLATQLCGPAQVHLGDAWGGGGGMCSYFPCGRKHTWTIIFQVQSNLCSAWARTRNPQLARRVPFVLSYFHPPPLSSFVVFQNPFSRALYLEILGTTVDAVFIYKMRA